MSPLSRAALVGIPQAMPQPPQLLGSSEVGMQTPLQDDQPAPQVQAPATQVSPPAMLQPWPQLPQLLMSVFWFDSQPSVWRWSQSSNPASQAAKKQAPAEHPAEPWGNEQIVPQPPQLLGSKEVLAQSPPQSVWLGEHVAMQTPPMHDWATAQVVPQVPQLALSVERLAQYGAPLPGAHIDSEPQASAQVPPLQTCPLPQMLPQTPQLALSVAVLAQ